LHGFGHGLRKEEEMEQVGKIEKIEGNMATISVKRISACGESCKGCSSACKQPTIYFETEISDNGYEVGDYVEIKTENEVMLKQIAFLYGVPFLMMMITIGAVQLLLWNSPNKDIISALASIASLIVSFFILKAYDKNEMKKNTLKFTIGRKL
jgi:sigma-E factor negative regulatory protein RseC